MSIDYNRDRYGRQLPRRTRDKHCQDCGHNGMAARTISFQATGMLYDVCAAHESEYCGTPAERRAHEFAGHGAQVVPIGGWNAQPVIYGFER